MSSFFWFIHVILTYLSIALMIPVSEIFENRHHPNDYKKNLCLSSILFYTWMIVNSLYCYAIFYDANIMNSSDFTVFLFIVTGVIVIVATAYMIKMYRKNKQYTNEGIEELKRK